MCFSLSVTHEILTFKTSNNKVTIDEKFKSTDSCIFGSMFYSDYIFRLDNEQDKYIRIKKKISSGFFCI